MFLFLGATAGFCVMAWGVVYANDNARIYYLGGGWLIMMVAICWQFAALIRQRRRR